MQEFDWEIMSVLEGTKTAEFHAEELLTSSIAQQQAVDCNESTPAPISKVDLWELRRVHNNANRKSRIKDKKKEKAELKRLQEEEEARWDEQKKTAAALEAELQRQSSVQGYLQRQELVREALDSGLRLVVDCSFCAVMNVKEVRSLAKQLQLCISHNWRAARPAALTFTSFDGPVAELCLIGRLGPPPLPPSPSPASSAVGPSSAVGDLTRKRARVGENEDGVGDDDDSGDDLEDRFRRTDPRLRTVTFTASVDTGHDGTSSPFPTPAPVVTGISADFAPPRCDCCAAWTHDATMADSSNRTAAATVPVALRSRLEASTAEAVVTRLHLQVSNGVGCKGEEQEVERKREDEKGHVAAVDRGDDYYYCYQPKGSRSAEEGEEEEGRSEAAGQVAAAPALPAVAEDSGGCGLRAKKAETPMRLRANVTGQSLFDAFQDRREKIVVLSPDATEPLLDIDPDHVYVVGGIVDRVVKKGITRDYAAQREVTARRLPIQEHAEGLGLGKGAQKCPVLNVDSVIAALLEFYASGDWVVALDKAIPGRKRGRNGAPAPAPLTRELSPGEGEPC